MKKNAFGIMIGVLLISGCTPFYTNRPAPIVNLNAPMPGSYQGAQTMQQPVLPQNQAQPLLMPITPNPTQQVEPVRPVSPPNTNAAFGSNNIVAAETSPYAEPARETQNGNITNNVAPANDDGWSIRPGESVKADNSEPATANMEQGSAVRPQPSEANVGGNNTATSNAAESRQSDTPSVSEATGQSADREQVASVAPSQAQPTETPSSPIKALLQKASASLGKGDLDGAAAYLENAQRIDPKNAKILYDIANIRFHQGRFKDAENFASRAVKVGGGNAMLKKSWSMIANARTKLGDSQGAILAAEKAASY